ncbi:MAG: hypothetical protein N3D16_00910 [Anaerolineales bacterium]|nr:hypothetical protein [Anaerolineales bacterium]
MSNIVLVLQITLFGMFLIFAAMVLLWTLLSMMVFVLARVQKNPIDEDELSNEEDNAELMRKQAVAVAVSAALHQRVLAGPGRFPLPPTAFVSAWQAVLRSHILNKRGAVR